MSQETRVTVEILNSEKMARALEVPMYQLFYDGNGPPKLPNLLYARVRKNTRSQRMRRRPGNNYTV
jgi:hypothetical protein